MSIHYHVIILKMKRRSQVLGSTSSRSKRRNSNHNSAAENVTQRGRRIRISGEVLPPCSISKVRKVTGKKPRTLVMKTNMEENEQQREVTLTENRRDSRRARESVREWSTEPEPSLSPIRDLRDLHGASASASEESSILSERPYLWKELQFGNNTISTEELCAIIYRSPHLRTLTLCGRQDTDAILHAVLASSHSLQTLELTDCRGSEHQVPVRGDILSRIVRSHEQLRNIVLDDTVVTASDFYQVLQQYIGQLDEVLITVATREDGLAFLGACDQYSVPVETLYKEEFKNFRNLIELLPKDV